MAQAFAVTETIAAPLTTVWAALTDWDRAPEWMPGVESMTADGPTEVGTALRFTARGKERPSEIVAVDPGTAVTLRSQQGNVTADYAYRCESASADPTTTVVGLVADCRTTGPILAVLGPLLRIVMKRTDSGQLKALKAMVEAGPADG